MQWLSFSYFIQDFDKQSVMDCVRGAEVLLHYWTLLDQYAKNYNELGYCSMVI